MRKMQILLIEDEKEHSLKYKECVSKSAYPACLYMAEGETDGLNLAQKFPFDVIILDLELHESDGDGISFLKKLKKLDLPELPYIIVATNNCSPKTRQLARDNGADYIFWKGKHDYSAKLVIDFAHVYFRCKIDAGSDDPVQVQKVSLEDDIRMRISKIGINDDMTGKKYMVDAIAIVAKSSDIDINLHRDVFPVLAKKYSKSIASIQRAIENAINKAWCIIDADILSAGYSAAVSGSKGTPTNKEFIFYFAEQVKNIM